jgi:hypothetical protein
VSDLFEGHDLTTHEGRLGAIRLMRDHLDPAEYKRCLEEVRRRDPYPVIGFMPPDGVGFCTRGELLGVMRRGQWPDAELEQLLVQKQHLAGTVFMVLVRGEAHSWTRTVVLTTPPGVH